MSLHIVPRAQVLSGYSGSLKIATLRIQLDEYPFIDLRADQDVHHAGVAYALAICRDVV